MFGCGSGCHPRRRISHHHRPLPERGWIQFLLLKLINEKPMHAYHLIEDMEARGYVRLGRFRTGSIYTILNRMENHGLLTSKQEESESGRTRRVYNVTSNGRTALKIGLEHMLRRKKMLDELSDYYAEHFQNEKPSDERRGEE